MHPRLAEAFGDLWTAVVRAGGAVRFAVDAPEGEIRGLARRAVEDVEAGSEELLLTGPDDAPTATVFLRRPTDPVVAHRAEVLRLMVHPRLQGRGLGTALLAAAVARARERGLEQLLLSARGGTPLPAYYRSLGWMPVGVWPGALRIGPDDYRDEHWFQLRL